MRTTRRYIPGKGLIEQRAQGDELVPRPSRAGARGRRQEVRFDPSRNRLEVQTSDGSVVGIELPKGS